MATRNTRGSGDWLDRAARLYTRIVSVLAVTILTVLVVVMGVQVFFRYVLNDSLIWAEELCGYLLVLMTFLLLGAAFERGEMVSLQIFTNMLRPRARLALMIPLYAIMALFLLTLAYYGYLFAELNGRSSIPAVDFIISSIIGRDVTLVVPSFWLYLTIPVGCVILACHFVLAIARMVRGLAGAIDPARAMPANSGSAFRERD